LSLHGSPSISKNEYANIKGLSQNRFFRSI
jgi:hypothetical protein